MTLQMQWLPEMAELQNQQQSDGNQQLFVGLLLEQEEQQKQQQQIAGIQIVQMQRVQNALAKADLRWPARFGRRGGGGRGPSSMEART